MSRAYQLRDGEKPRRGIRRIAEGRADDALEQLQEPGDKTVHEARKDLKKMRALLRLVRGDLGKRTYRSENRRYRDAGRRLSAARDAEVKLQTLDGLQEHFGGDIDEVAVEPFREVLQRECEAESKAIQNGAGPLRKSAAEIAEGRRRVGEWRLRSKGWKLVGPGLRRSYSRGRKAMKLVSDRGGAEEAHEWRKRAKDLWYQLLIVQCAWPEVMGATSDEVHELGDLLGDHHDLEVLARDARARGGLFMGKNEAEQLAGLAARRQDELLEKALQIGARVYAEKPKRFEQRLHRYWLAWRG